MKKKWKIRDLIDLEYFLAREKTVTGEGSDFDRKTFLKFSENHSEPHERRDLIRFWLERRRASESHSTGEPAVLPGTIYTELQGMSRVVLAFLALVVGAALAWGLLSYQGRQPINVFTFLWVIVAPQVLLLFIFLVASGISRARLAGSVRIVYPILARTFQGLFHRLSQAAGKRLSADRKNQFASAIGLYGRTRTVYGSVFFWPLFTTAQIVGILFNIGVLCAMMVRITITDLAFGWQSTLQSDTETIYRIVQTLSLPWQWFTDPPVSHPTISQIAGSKMVLKEGIYHLATENLVAWWPFLLFAVIFYALLPRVAMLGAGLYLQRRAIDSLGFGHAACDMLITRMKTPVLDTISRPYPGKTAISKPEFFPSGTRYQKTAEEALAPAILMIPEEISDRITESEINEFLDHFLAMAPESVIPIQNDIQLDAEPLEATLSEFRKKDKNTDNQVRIVIVQEAWQPPIKETLSWIAGIREVAGKSLGIIIALTGKPAPQTFLTLPADMDRIIWEQAVNSLGDPYIRVEILGR